MTGEVEEAIRDAVLHLLSTRVGELTRAGDLTRSNEISMELTVAGQRRNFTGFAAFWQNQ
jgi:hypothetical protein